MRMLDLFSGIGGFSLAAQWVWGDELEIVAFVEIDDFCKKVLAKNFPGVPILDDIKKIQWIVADSKYQGHIGRGGRSTKNGIGMDTSKQAGKETWGATSRCDEIIIGAIDLLTGGWPCPPVSCAGKRRGTADDRWLWPEVVRAVREIRPKYCLFENVPGLLSIEGGVVFESVCADLETEGYEVVPLVIPAASVGAPHRRDRVWIVANHQGLGCGSRGTESAGLLGGARVDGSDRHAPDTARELLNGNGNGRTARGREHSDDYWQEHWYEVATRLCGMDARVPNRVDRLKSLGNSVVPQVVYQIMMAIKESDK